MVLENRQLVKQRWEERILPNWPHKDRPEGERFLGSIRCKRESVDKLLDCIGEDFSRLEKFTFDRMNRSFSSLDQYWINLVTFAISEYAYYDATEGGFWEGLLKRLRQPNTDASKDAIKAVLDKGFKQLGLIQAQGGYKYVSTLWLQSGIPARSSEHFAQLVEELAREYGWWDLAHYDDPGDLSKLMLDVSNDKHPSWKTLNRFLGQEGEDASQPGRVLQGIAAVALELERLDLSAEVFKDESKREERLRLYRIPNNFFLRDWNDLLKVLSYRPKSSTSSKPKLRQRPKPLSVCLDLGDLETILLILPTQRLWEPDWKDYRQEYCHIDVGTEQLWDERFPQEGPLEIPELSQKITSLPVTMPWELKNKSGKQLKSWSSPSQNISNYLIFDAWTGQQITPENHRICNVSELVYFCPGDTEVDLSGEITVVSRHLGCSIAEWRGQHVTLQGARGQLKFRFPEIVSINWQAEELPKPRLQGLRLKGKEPIYLEVPRLWYPGKERTEISIVIENLDLKERLPEQKRPIPLVDAWEEIDFTESIKSDGQYSLKVYDNQNRPIYEVPRFSVRTSYPEPQPTSFHVRVKKEGEEIKITDLPLKPESLGELRSLTLNLEGLWPLELVTFELKGEAGEATQDCTEVRQAESDGSLRVRLTNLLAKLSSGYDTCQLTCDISEIRDLVYFQKDPISCTWSTEGIHCSNLVPGRIYNLYCWNLLHPDQDPQPQKLEVPLVKETGSAVFIPLRDLGLGVYHLDLRLGQVSNRLGWWSNLAQINLPDDDGQIPQGLDPNWLQKLVEDLRNNPEKMAPELRDKLLPEILISKLKRLIENIERLTKDAAPVPTHPDSPNKIRSGFCVIKIDSRRKKEFQKIFKKKLESGLGLEKYNEDPLGAIISCEGDLEVVKRILEEIKKERSIDYTTNYKIENHERRNHRRNHQGSK